MRQLAVSASKAAAIWAALLGGSMIGLAILPLGVDRGGDGPFSSGQALLLVNGAYALMLSWLASRMLGSTLRKAIILFVLAYTTATALSHVEAIYFGSFLRLPEGLLASIAVVDAIKFAAAAALAAWLWPEKPLLADEGPALPLRIALIAGLYVLVYFIAGGLIAWQSEAVRNFYGDGLQLDLAQLAMLQVARGLVWALLAVLVARFVAGSRTERALLAGAAFSVFMAAPLLNPSGVMPWPVRQAHLVEVGVSNFLFGMAAVAILLANRRGRKAR